MKRGSLERQFQRFDDADRAAHREFRLVAASRLADGIASLLAEPVRLTVHDNRSTMVSFRRKPDAIHYRVHHMFLDAPDEVVQALAVFSGGGGGQAGRRRRVAGSRIDAFVRIHRSWIAPSRPGWVEARGRIHNLQTLFDQLNAQHFGGQVHARIGWGTWRGGPRRRTIKTGVYVQEARLIRIHPSLDRPEVPEFYVAAVIHHEMLHQVIPVVETSGRRVVHGKEFRRWERTYPDYTRAKAWEEANLPLLLGRSSTAPAERGASVPVEP